MITADNPTEILHQAKTAIAENDNEKVAALLIPLVDHPNIQVAGVSCHIGGLALYALGQQNEAFEILQKAIDLNYPDPELYINFGASMQQLAQYDRAESIYKSGLAVCGRVPGILSSLASIQSLRGHLTDSEESLKEALKIDSNDPRGWANLGKRSCLKKTTNPNKI